MAVNKELVERLWVRHTTISHSGKFTTDRQGIIEDYKLETGEDLPYGSLSRYITAFNKERMFEKSHTLTFNERTENFVDEPMGLLNPDDLLVAIGLNPSKFELSPHNTSNRWWTDNPDENKKRMMSGQIKVGFRERIERVSQETLKSWLESIDIEPFYVEKPEFKGNGLLELGLADLHFDGQSDYSPQLNKMLHWIESQEWNEILLLLGGDVFDANNSEGLTVKGTKVNHNLSICEMYDEAFDFYGTLLNHALKHSKKVKVVYLEGNHDKDITLAFAYMLKQLYPQVEFDITTDVYKRHIYGKVFIGLLHGDKPRQSNKFAKLFFSLFKSEIAVADYVEIHSQHYHHESSKDDMGFMLRSLPTAKGMNGYEYENGHVGSNKRFQAFIYSEDTLEAIIYI